MLRVMLAGSGVLLMSACATAINGAQDTVVFTSSPSGATVSARDVKRKKIAQTCITPCKLELDRKWPHNVLFELADHEPQKLMLIPQITGEGVASSIGNAFTFGIGDMVDGPNAAYSDLKPNPLKATLQKIEKNPE